MMPKQSGLQRWNNERCDCRSWRARVEILGLETRFSARVAVESFACCGGGGLEVKHVVWTLTDVLVLF